MRCAKLIGSRDIVPGWGVGANSPHSFFARTQTVNSTDAKTFYPHGLRPWDGKWEETGGDHARFAERDPRREKAVGLHPTTRWGRKAPDPFSLAHRMDDTAQPGQLPFVFTWSQ